MDSSIDILNNTLKLLVLGESEAQPNLCFIFIF